ncbi:MAG: hypothetical protein O3C27_15060 [Actinomycetota bacterium]|nr:hypothetical protein [Actinomycetota bacterium]
MTARLDNVRRAHGLDRRTLLASHREVAELEELGLAPTLGEFWATTANPATEPLVRAACAVIDEELIELRRVLQRFGQVTLAASRDADYEPAAYRVELGAALERLSNCGIDRSSLDRLGARWQTKLRRAARAASLPRSVFLSVRRADDLIGQLEMELLDRAPRAHDDRLLSAFELAHADIHAHLRDGHRDGLRKTSVVVPRRAARKPLAAI